jgi:hypothetical protein
MTTATTRDNQGQQITTDSGGTAGPLDYGAGWVVPAGSVNPGLVYDSAPADWVRFLCGTHDFAADDPNCVAVGGGIDPVNFNSPSIAVGALGGTKVMTRTVRSVASKPQTYLAQVDAPAGTSMTVSPTKFTVAPGETKTFQVTITRTSAAFDTYTTGALTWTDGQHNVRIPVAVRPAAVSAPVQVTGSGAAGSAKIGVTTGYTGNLLASVQGLVPAAVNTATLANPSRLPFPTAKPVASEHTAKITVTVPAGTKLARFSTFDADYPEGSDVDLFVYKAGTASIVGTSGGGTASEEVSLADLPAGDYDVYVDLFSIGGDGTSLNVKLYNWALGAAAAGNATVTPATQPVTLAKPTEVTVNWTGLDAGKRWLGVVNFSDGGSGHGSTAVRVDS